MGTVKRLVNEKANRAATKFARSHQLAMSDPIMMAAEITTLRSEIAESRLDTQQAVKVGLAWMEKYQAMRNQRAPGSEVDA
jgi:hypothetical protein